MVILDRYWFFIRRYYRGEEIKRYWKILVIYVINKNSICGRGYIDGEIFIYFIKGIDDRLEK